MTDGELAWANQRQAGATVAAAVRLPAELLLSACTPAPDRPS
jgi:hypothetical protein